jgi:ribosomal protein S18 acetylase RimI-like enzyme
VTLNPSLPLPLLSLVEDAGLNASAPPQQRWLDGWMLRLSPGKAKRARCVNALAPGRLPLAERLALAREAYRAAGLPLIFRITPFTAPPSLEEELADLRFHVLDDTRVMVCSQLPSAPPGDLPLGGRIERVGHGALAQAVGELRASPLSQRSAHAERLAASPVPFQGFVLRNHERGVLSCGQYAIEGSLVGLYDVFTAPAVRGCGAATALCRWMLREAMGAGARVGYLQVEHDNVPARAIYHRLGFVDGYGYRYRTDDPSVK